MKTKQLIALVLFFAITGCASQQGVNYYWGNYSETLYALKKAPGPDTLQKHTDELEKIIQKSNDKNYRVPPGIQAELGYRHAQQGESAKANAEFAAELAAYPESRLFVEKLQGMLSK